jgi:anti-sigma factor RsiW
MTCAEIEIVLCDYFDSTLAPAEKARVEEHFAACEACAELARDSRAALDLFERTPEVEPPQELVTKLLHQVPRDSVFAESILRWLSERAGGLFGPLAQPRVVMSMALIVLSFSTMGRLTGIKVNQLRPADLNPVKVWAALDDRLQRTWDRTLKYYESMRFVYEMQTRLREWTEQEEQPAAAPAAPAPGGDARRLPARAEPAEGQPR